MYKELLLDHYQHPRNYGSLENPDIMSGDVNPSCGDSIVIQANVNQNNVNNIKFTGKGCVISQATASFLSEFCVGKSLQEVLLLDKESLQTLLGLQLGPLRSKCILLPLHALQQGIINYQNK